MLKILGKLLLPGESESGKNVKKVMEKTEKTTETKRKSIREHAKKMHGLMAEFKDFLKEYKIVGIAAGLVIGAAVTTLTQSIVVGLITPAIQLLIPTGVWKDLSVPVNGVNFQIGIVLNGFINFIVVALMFFIFVKLFMKKEKVGKI